MKKRPVLQSLRKTQPAYRKKYFYGMFLMASAFSSSSGEGAPATLNASKRAIFEREALPQNASNEFYWVDLVGLKVVNVRDEELGVVAELFDNGAHPVMRVVAGETERLLPFVGQVVRQVELAQGRIRVEWELDW